MSKLDDLSLRNNLTTKAIINKTAIDLFIAIITFGIALLFLPFFAYKHILNSTNLVDEDNDVQGSLECQFGIFNVLIYQIVNAILAAILIAIVVLLGFFLTQIGMGWLMLTFLAVGFIVFLFLLAGGALLNNIKMINFSLKRSNVFIQDIAPMTTILKLSWLRIAGTIIVYILVTAFIIFPLYLVSPPGNTIIAEAFGIFALFGMFQLYFIYQLILDHIYLYEDEEQIAKFQCQLGFAEIFKHYLNWSLLPLAAVYVTYLVLNMLFGTPSSEAGNIAALLTFILLFFVTALANSKALLLAINNTKIEPL